MRGKKSASGNETVLDAAVFGCRDEALYVELSQIGRSRRCESFRNVRRPLTYFGFCNVTP